jgi:hypothetical protein
MPNRHPLEKKFNASAQDILSAVEHGFRAQVDVKGKLAEWFLFKELRKIQEAGTLENVVWHDSDSKPDFEVTLGGQVIRVECKNVRSGPHNIVRSGPCAGWFRVEIQKTRNGIDRTGKATRAYRVDQFDVLAACTFNQAGEWRHLFCPTRKLAVREASPEHLVIMQPVPPQPEQHWTLDILPALRAAVPRRR